MGGSAHLDDYLVNLASFVPRLVLLHERNEPSAITKCSGGSRILEGGFRFRRITVIACIVTVEAL